ncbi:tail fiber domain-containing protein [Sphingomonas sp.]|uniref:tail fiber domain-containing protein n=1 Tax=Sphingomonas sp. TaxID=28214 RepID=UPI00257F85AE|nr:tail fiber domain-containing protein [Sphingomonas sp.]
MNNDIDRRATLGVMLGGLAVAGPSTERAALNVAGSAAPIGPERSAAIQSAVDQAKRSGQPGGVTLPIGRIASRSSIVVAGDYHGGITLRSNGGEIAGSNAPVFKLGNLADPGPEHRLNVRLAGTNLVGPGKDVAGSVGVAIENTADVFLADGIYRQFRYAIRSTGGLLWDAYNLTLRDSGYGLYATETSDFAPNSINLYSARIMKCDVAIHTANNPNGVFNFWGGEIEGNNERGNDRDGRKVVEHEAAGSINYIGAHFESNPGQYNLYYNGADQTKTLMMLGCQVIAGAGEQVHVERGRGSFIASRIVSGGKSGIVFGAQASGTMIDCEADVGGPGVGNVAALRAGRLAFGANPTSVEPLISATAAAVREARGIVARWQGDTIQLQFCDAAGRVNGRLQTSTGDHVLHNANAGGGWIFAAGDRPVVRIGRGGAQAIEGSAPNATLCGTAALPWAGGYTQTAFRVTSDRRRKRDIRPISERERAAALRCKALLRAFRLTAEYERDGESAVTHYGVIAQDVIAAFKAEGLDALATGIVRHTAWPAQTDGDGGTRDAGDLYSVSYEQLYALLISVL